MKLANMISGVTKIILILFTSLPGVELIFIAIHPGVELIFITIHPGVELIFITIHPGVELIFITIHPGVELIFIAIHPALMAIPGGVATNSQPCVFMYKTLGEGSLEGKASVKRNLEYLLRAYLLP